MTDQPTQSDSAIASADVKHKSKGFSAIWVIPIVAAVIGGWMVFQNLLHEKPIVVVSFKNAAGVQAGKTLVKFRDITIGKVTEVTFGKDLGTILVTLEFEGIEHEHISAKTRFWIVKPRIGVGGVSGLDTLLSGAYIDADPPPEVGKPATKFVGLEEPGNYQAGNPGTSYILKSSELGSLSRGSPIKYRDVKVGQVTRYRLAENNAAVDIEIFIQDPYDKLVRHDTRFWNISGVEVDVGAEGIKVDMASLATLISGGVAFSATDASGGKQARTGSVFNLYKSETEEAEATEVAFYVPMKLYFVNGVNGLLEGAPVEYKGLRLGTVDKVGAEGSADKTEILTFATIRIEPGRLPGEDSRREESDESRTKAVHQFFDVLAARGVRAQLKTGNLLTGKSLVVLEEFQDATPESVKYENGIAIFPTMPESLADIMQKADGIMTKINEILAKIDAIPITRIGNNLDHITAKINKIPVVEIGNNVAKATAQIDSIPVTKLSNDLAKTLESINALVQSLNAAQGGVLGVQTREALAEITRAAHALRGMAEYLERHPEALLKGKKN
jgi:paraquat-inducible protein B